MSVNECLLIGICSALLVFGVVVIVGIVCDCIAIVKRESGNSEEGK